MPIATTTINGETKSEKMPGKSRVLRELKEVFPGARFRERVLKLDGHREPQHCVQLIYNGVRGRETSVVALRVRNDDPNFAALWPLTIMRAAFRSIGYETKATLRYDPKRPVACEWIFKYEAINKPEAQPDEGGKKPDERRDEEGTDHARHELGGAVVGTGEAGIHLAGFGSEEARDEEAEGERGDHVDVGEEARGEETRGEEEGAPAAEDA